MKFVGYYRVSTQRQGDSGLGLEAQQTIVQRFVGSMRGEVVQEFTDIVSGRKSMKHRPELEKALDYCRKHGCALVVGRLDRLARNVSFFLDVIDNSKVRIYFAELPEARPESAEGRMMLVNLANYAEFEARRIGERTKLALAAAKARGVVLGATGRDNLLPNIKQRQEASKAFADGLAGMFEGFRLRGLTQRQMVAELNAHGIKTARGKAWSLTQVQRVLAKLSA